jgi:hypothetical protein
MPQAKVALKKTKARTRVKSAIKPIARKANAIKKPAPIKKSATVFALLGSRAKADIVYFEQESELVAPSTIQSVTIKALANECRVKVSQEILDIYFSPHRLDLSKARFIEKHQITAPQSLGFKSEILPIDAVVERLQLLSLIDFDRSEIFNYFRNALAKIDISLKKSGYQRSFNQKRSSHYHPTWRDRSLVSWVYSIAQNFKKTIYAIRFYTQRYFTKVNDETIPLASMNNAREYVASQKIRIIQTKSATTAIDELIQNSADEPYIITPNKYVPSSNFGIFSWQFSLKPLVVFAILAVSIALPVKVLTYWQDVSVAKGEVLGDTEAALENLEQAKSKIEQFDLLGASDYLANANEKFVSAKQQLDGVTSLIGVVTDLIPINNLFRSGNHLLQLGEHMTAAGERLLSATELMMNRESDLPLTSRIKAFQIESQRALLELKKAEAQLAYIDVNHVPEGTRNQFETLKKSLPTVITGLETSQEMLDFSLNFLGDKTIKRYLLVFQNDNELRATGGFMGSFAMIDIKSGEITDISTPAGGTYDLRAGLTNLYQAPKSLQLINPRWEFQDTNWWPDWPTSAKNIDSFYTKSGGPTIDGVIAINSDFLGDVLRATGPIEMPEYGRQITAENFELELQINVELEADKRAPKKIIGDMMPKMIDRMLHAEPTELLKIISVVNQGLAHKDIMIHLNNADDQEFIAKHQWDGRQKETAGDYLQVVATNIGGGKTDNVIDQVINHQATIASDGSIINTVRIERSHFGPIDPHFTSQANRSFIRVYVPQGSTLIEAVGFDATSTITAAMKLATTTDEQLEIHKQLQAEHNAKIDTDSATAIYNENNKTVFGNWMTTSAGATRTAVLVYKLPFKLDWKNSKPDRVWSSLVSALLPQNNYASYSLLLQKQSGGSDDAIITSSVQYPETMAPITLYPNEIKSENQMTQFVTTLTKDIFYFIGFKK